MQRLRLLWIACLLPCSWVGPAAAQSISGGVAGSGFHPLPGRDPHPAMRDTAPPGLPGSQTRDNGAGPGDVALDVPPTEALFSAINRGDAAAAREALNRGADLHGHNVLGMTPLDLSIDLARNDITFLLLSLRNQTEIGGPPPPRAASQVATGATKTARPSREVRLAARAKPGAAPSPAPPSLHYASIPAAPVPEAGFLGFGGHANP